MDFLESKQNGPPTWEDPAYITWAEKNAEKVRLSPDGLPEITARLVRIWTRDDREIRRGHILSASSGPKDYMINDVITFFSAGADEVMLLVVNATPVLLRRAVDRWYDTSGRIVEVQRAAV